MIHSKVLRKVVIESYRTLIRATLLTTSVPDAYRTLLVDFISKWRIGSSEKNSVIPEVSGKSTTKSGKSCGISGWSFCCTLFSQVVGWGDKVVAVSAQAQTARSRCFLLQGSADSSLLLLQLLSWFPLEVNTSFPFPSSVSRRSNIIRVRPSSVCFS